MQPPQDYSGGNPPAQPNWHQIEPMASGGGPRGEVSLEAIGDAWNVLKENMGPWLAATAVYAAFVVVVQVIQRVVMPTPTPGATNLGSILGTSLLINVVVSVIGMVLMGGAFRMAIRNLQQGSADLGSFFSVADVAPSLIIAGLITNLCVLLGALFCIIPGIFISLGWQMAPLLIADRSVPAMQALSHSWAAMSGKRMSMCALLFVLGLINLLGAACCLVGLFVTLPLSVLTLAVVYTDLFEAGGQGAALQEFPVTPIASPGL